MSIIWEEGMRIGEGAEWPKQYRKFVNKPKKEVGSGTLTDPYVCIAFQLYAFE